MRVLVVEDDPRSRRALADLLAELGHQPAEAGSVADAIAAYRDLTPDVAIVDLGLPDGNGLDLVSGAPPGTSVFVLTGQGSVRNAVDAMKAGAHDFFVKPLRPPQLRAALDHLGSRAERPAVPPGQPADVRPAEECRAGDGLGGLLGASAPMQEVLRLLTRVAVSDAPVFLYGESGTGKEVAARAIHALSRRASGPFVGVNCGAISPSLVESELFGHEKGSFTGAERRREGTFELARRGTLFLDEVTETPLEMQVKLLRVLETKSFRRVGGTDERDVDVRVVASSNRDVVDAVASGTFREDLYYRLAVFPLRLPPLRERLADVPILAREFLSRVEAEERRDIVDIEPAALEALGRHAWPGNVRELRNVVHRAYVLSDSPAVSLEAVEAVLAAPAPVPPGAGGVGDALLVPVRVGDTARAAEQKLIDATIAAVGGDKRAAAEMLGLSLKTVYNKLRSRGGA
ncbi:MAG: sigma-54-dependent Fis family transcriptional regulator [Holophagales bacterium]|nr:sigma-54-dependent Fis family transcriptional regulator [Holophagales bacterium]